MFLLGFYCEPNKLLLEINSNKMSCYYNIFCKVSYVFDHHGKRASGVNFMSCYCIYEHYYLLKLHAIIYGKVLLEKVIHYTDKWKACNSFSYVVYQKYFHLNNSKKVNNKRCYSKRINV